MNTLGLGTKLKARTPYKQQLSGFVNDTNRFFKVSTGTAGDWDDKGAITILSWVSPIYNTVIGANTTYHYCIHALNDTTNDTGFYGLVTGGYSSPSITFAVGDGSGGPKSVVSAGGNGAFGWGGTSPTAGQSNSGLTLCVMRYDGSGASAGNNQHSATITSTGISFSSGSNSATDYGTIGNNHEIYIGYTGSIGTNDLKVHKVSIWFRALSDSDILKMAGLTGDTLADSTSEQKNFHIANRFASYSDLSITAPDHEWNFNNVGSYGSSGSDRAANLSDDGTSTSYNLSPSTSSKPMVGGSVQY